MNVAQFNVTPEQAAAAIADYKSSRNRYDKRDWEIERIYRQIAKGRKVISAFDAIRNAGVDELGRPRLALMRADQTFCRCDPCFSDKVVFSNVFRSRASEWHFNIAWPGRPKIYQGDLSAALPRIPPMYRPADPSKYHLLWESVWTEAPPVDPYLLKRISRDAWVVLAAWELTDVELSVMRTNRA